MRAFKKLVSELQIKTQGNSCAKILLLSLFFINIIVYEERPPVKQTDEKTILGLYQFMKDVHEVFQAKQITYWIDSGTLLGAVRHGGIIPWDNDIDVCIDITDSDLFLEQRDLFEKLNIIYDQFNWGYGLRDKWTGTRCFFHYESK